MCAGGSLACWVGGPGLGKGLYDWRNAQLDGGGVIGWIGGEVAAACDSSPYGCQSKPMGKAG